MSRLSIAGAILALAATTLSPAVAQTTATWTNTSSNTAGWQNSGNWNNGVPNAVGSSASIIADITAPQTITLDGAVTLGNLTIGDPTAAAAASYTINAGTYTSGSSTLAGTLTFDVASGGATLTQTANSAANLITANIALADPLTISNAATSAALTLSGIVSGSGGITKTGTGPLTLSGANTFTGGLNLSAGSLRVGNNAALGTGTATIGHATVLMPNSTASRTLANALSLSGSFTLGDATNSGALNLTGAATLTGNTQITNASYVAMSGAISETGGARSLTKAGAGTLVLGGNNSYTGGTVISAGVLELGSNERLANTGNVTMTSGTFDLGGFTETINAFSATAAANVTAGTLNATGGYSFSNASGTITVNAALGGGSASLTKTGAGTVTLTGAGTFTGGATISAGVVQVGNNTALGTGAIMLTDATLRSDSSTARSLSNSLTIGGAVTLGGNPAGVLTFGNVNPVSLSADTALTNATAVTFTGGLSGTAGRTFTKAGAGTLTLGGASSVAGGVTIDAGGITVGTGGSLGGTVTVNTGATLTNAVNNGITGTVNVENGTFTVTNATTMGALSVTGTGGTIDGAGGLTASSISANISEGGTTTFSAVLAGSGGFTKTGAGTALMSGANSGYTGQVTLNGGLMQFGATSALGSGTLSLVAGTLSANTATGRTLSNSVVSFDGDVTIGDASNTGAPTFSGAGVLTGNRTLTFASNATLSGGLSGSFGFTKEGSGDFTLNGANTYSGTTNVNAGTLVLTASTSKTGQTNVNGGTLRLANNDALGGASGDSLVLTSGAIMSNGSGASNARAIANPVTLAGNVTVGAGQTYTGAVTFSGPVTLTGNRTLSTSVATTISGNIDDGGSGYRLTKGGGSTLTLSGSNSHSGGTTISNGQLTISSSAALGSGNVSINGGTLVATGANLSVMSWLNSGRIAASPNGGIAITGNSGETIDFSSYANLSLGASASATYSGTASFTPYETDGTKIYRLGGGAAMLTFNQVVTDGTNPTQVWIRGDTSNGVVRLGSSNSYTGGLYLDSGTLDVNADNQLGNITGSGSNAIVFTGGTLRYTTVTTDFSNKFAMPTANNQVAINTNSLNVSFATTITGSGGLSKANNGTLNAIAGYSGATNVSGGTLALTLSSTAAAPPAGTFTSTGGTLDLITSVDRTITARISQRTGGQVRLSPDAGRTLTLSGTLDRQTTTSGPGAITVASGLVRFDGTVTSVADTDWTVSGGTLELANALADQNDMIVSVAAGGTVKLGASDQILTSVAGLSGTLDLNGFSETLTSLAGSGTVTNTTTTVGSTLTLSAASTIAARLTDSGAGAGTLALVINPDTANRVFTISNSANDYRGGTTMQTGIMALGADNVLGSGGLTMNGGTLRSDSDTARAYSGALTVAGAVTLGNSTAGTAGAVTLSGPVEISGATRQFTVSGDTIISGTIGDGGNSYGLSKAGAGTLVLSGTNTYSGLTTVTAGILRVTGGNSTAGNTTLNGGWLQIGKDDVLASGTLTLQSGTLSSDTIATRVLNNPVAFTGNVTFGDATNYGTVVLTASGTSNAMRTFTVTSDVDMTGQLVGALGITKDGDAALTITNAANSYTGGTRINAGRIRVGSNSALGGASGGVTLSAGSLSSDGAAARSLANAFTVAGDFTLGDAADNGELTLTGNTLLTGNRTITFASDVTLTGVLGEQGAGRVLTKDGAGTFTLANAVSYTGGTVLNAGRIRVGVAAAFGTATTTLNGGALSSDGATERTISNPIAYGGNVTLGNATDTGVLTFTGTQTLTGNRTITVASDVVMSSRIVDGGSGFTKSGAARLTLTGTSTLTGPVNVDQGTLFLATGGVLPTGGTVDINAGGTLAGSGSMGSVTVSNAGTISPGNSPGTILPAGAVFEAGGNYNWQLLDAAGVAGQTTGWDLIALTSAGSLDLTGLASTSTATRFNLNTWTLSGIGPDVNGPAANFEITATSNYRFALVSFADLSKLLLPNEMTAVANLDLTSLFNINTGAVNGTAGWDGSQTPPQRFMSVRVGLDGQSIDLVIVPEPGALALAAIGVLAAIYQGTRQRRRR